MGLKESLKELQEKERKYSKISLKREVKKAFTKIKKEKISEKKCVICEEAAKYSIKGSSDCYCKDCAIEYFGDLSHLKKIDSTNFQKDIYVITGNNNKFLEISRILDIKNLQQYNIDLAEIQEINARKIIEAKVIEAKKHHKGSFIVEDTSLYLDCLNGLPGPLIKWFLESLGCIGIYQLTRNYGNNKAIAKTIVGYYDNKKILFFEGVINGTIVSPRGDKNFGWDPIFQPDESDKTFGEMDKKEKNSLSMRNIALIKLKKYLQTQ